MCEEVKISLTYTELSAMMIYVRFDIAQMERDYELNRFNALYRKSIKSVYNKLVNMKHEMAAKELQK